MALGALARDETLEVIEACAKSADLTLVVGAGASVEATLPPWSRLLNSLLGRAAHSLGSLQSDDDRAAWIDETIRKDSFLGAAAVVEAVSGGQLQSWLIDSLFGGHGPAGFEPGPISVQVAHLQREAGAFVITTNYDDLLERALQQQGVPRSKIKSYVRRRQAKPDEWAITHLHGYAGRDQTKTPLILSEEHYHRMQRGTSWQEQLMLDRLDNSDCLFVGSSLSDPNLIRYLYGAGRSTGRFRAALFVRQEDDLEPSVRRAREVATRQRWARCGVDALFLDHFSDAAQLLAEIRLHRACNQRGEAYVPVVERAGTWLQQVHRERLGLHRKPRFLVQQAWLSDRLQSLLNRGVDNARKFGVRLGNGERLQLVVWLADAEGRTLTGWGHSDRAHRDPRTVEPVPIQADSEWVAVRAFCQGTTFERDRDVYASRWKYVRGLPIVLHNPSRLPVGCISVASTVPGRRSMLKRMEAGVRSAFNEFLENGVVDLLQVPSS